MGTNQSGLCSIRWWRQFVPLLICIQLIAAISPVLAERRGHVSLVRSGAGADGRLVLDATVEDARDAAKLVIGKGKDGAVFAIDSNGTKCVYRALTASGVRLEFTDSANRMLGTISYGLTAGETKWEARGARTIRIEYRTSGGESLVLTNGGVTAADRHLAVRWETKGAAITGKVDKKEGDGETTIGNLEGISDRLRGNQKMRSLLQLGGRFLSVPALKRVVPGFSLEEGQTCLRAGVECLVAAAYYIVSIGTLLAACGETAGIGCYIALAVHPGICAVVAEKCSAAVDACEKPNAN